MFKVKLSTEPTDFLIRQTPNNSGKWGAYQFYINSDIEEADFWIVNSKGLKKKEKCVVSPENTIFITGEPKTVYRYSKAFVKQFNLAIVCQDTKHPKQIYSQTALPWLVGRDPIKANFTLGYDDFVKNEINGKTGLISVITSSKAFTKGHKDRMDFVHKLKEYYGDKLDVFGRGIESFDDKWDVIAPYKYHICVENSSFPHYWTEKLADSYLGEAFPFYFGCSNIDEYFPENSYRVIDIYDFESTIKIIDNAISDNLYDNSIQVLKESKNLVLNKYNLFSVIAENCSKLNPNAPKKEVILKSEKSFYDFSKYITLASQRLYFNLKHKIKLF